MDRTKSERILLAEFDETEYGEAWVDVRPRLTYGDRLAIRGASRRIGESGRTEIYLEGADLKALELSIAAWSFDGPVTVAALEALDGELGDWLSERIRDVQEASRRPAEATKSPPGTTARRRRR